MTSLAALLLTGCTAGSETSPTDGPPATASTPSAPDPEAIRDVDFGDLEWTWDTQGMLFTVQLTDGAGVADDPYYEASAQFTLGEPTYADANGDGLTDAAVPLTWETGNGVAENWFIWLAQADAPSAPQQIPFPVASAARCGDGVESVEAVAGGFRVNEIMRSTLERDGPCAQTGTMERSRDVVVVGDGTGDGSWPATADGQGWGGYCPVKEYTEGEYATAQGRVGPSDAAPETSASGEKLYSPLKPYPFQQPEGWRLTGFLPDDQVDDSVVCVWLPDHGD